MQKKLISKSPSRDLQKFLANTIERPSSNKSFFAKTNKVELEMAPSTPEHEKMKRKQEDLQVHLFKHKVLTFNDTRRKTEMVSREKKKNLKITMLQKSTKPKATKVSDDVVSIASSSEEL